MRRRGAQLTRRSVATFDAAAELQGKKARESDGESTALIGELGRRLTMNMVAQRRGGDAYNPPRRCDF